MRVLGSEVTNREPVTQQQITTVTLASGDVTKEGACDGPQCTNVQIQSPCSLPGRSDRRCVLLMLQNFKGNTEYSVQVRANKVHNTLPKVTWPKGGEWAKKPLIDMFPGSEFKKEENDMVYESFFSVSCACRYEDPKTGWILPIEHNARMPVRGISSGEQRVESDTFWAGHYFPYLSCTS